MEQNSEHIDLKKAYDEQVLILEKKDSKIESLEFELKQIKKLIYLGKQERFVASKKGEDAPTLFDVPVIEELTPAQVKVISYEKAITKKQASN